MDTDKNDLKFLQKLPAEVWSLIVSYLPRISRQSLSCLCGFQEIIDGKLDNTWFE